MRVRFSPTQLKINEMTENTKWNFKNSRFLGKIEGKLYTLRQLIHPDQTLVIEKIEEIEKLVKKIEL